MKAVLSRLSLLCSALSLGIVFGQTSTQTRQLTTLDGTYYVYEYAEAKENKSTISNLTAAGYGVIAPDLLGYGDSDRPTDIGAYSLRRMSGHLAEILDDRGVQKVVGLAHDWGTNVMSRALFWHPERFEKAAFLSTGYAPAGLFFDVDGSNAASLQRLGYTQYGYWYFFNSYDAAQLAQNKIDSFYALTWPQNLATWAENLANIGAARAWLDANTTTPLPEYVDEKEAAEWKTKFSRENALEAALNCYKSVLRGIQAKDEQNLMDEFREIHVPVLAIGGLRDLVARADELPQTLEPWAKAGLTVHNVDTGHWMMLEDPDGVNTALLNFLALS